MQTIELADDQLSKLDELARRRGVSRDVLLQRAVEDLLRDEDRRQAFDAGFGAWTRSGEPHEDGLTHQLRLRAEWDHRV